MPKKEYENLTTEQKYNLAKEALEKIFSLSEPESSDLALKGLGLHTVHSSCAGYGYGYYKKFKTPCRVFGAIRPNPKPGFFCFLCKKMLRKKHHSSQPYRTLNNAEENPEFQEFLKSLGCIEKLQNV